MSVYTNEHHEHLLSKASGIIISMSDINANAEQMARIVTAVNQLHSDHPDTPMIVITNGGLFGEYAVAV